MTDILQKLDAAEEAIMTDEENEWDAVDKYNLARETAQQALKGK